MDIRSVIWAHSATAAWVQSGESIIIVEAAGTDSTPRVLEGSAAAIWGSLDGVTSFHSVVAQLGLIYGVDPAGLNPVVEAFIRELAETGLLTLAD